jgi:hypothetical protein
VRDANAPTDEITVGAGDAAGNVYCLAVVEPGGEGEGWKMVRG